MSADLEAREVSCIILSQIMRSAGDRRSVAIGHLTCLFAAVLSCACNMSETACPVSHLPGQWPSERLMVGIEVKSSCNIALSALSNWTFQGWGPWRAFPGTTWGYIGAPGPEKLSNFCVARCKNARAVSSAIFSYSAAQSQLNLEARQRHSIRLPPWLCQRLRAGRRQSALWSVAPAAVAMDQRSP